MDNGKISVRYARALLETAKDLQCETAVYEGLIRLSNNYSHAITTFNEVLSNPMISPDEKTQLLKTQLLKTAIGEPIHPCLLQFLDFLIEKKRENKILLIALKYQEMYRKENNIVKAKVTAAAELEERTLQHLRDFVAETFHADVEMHVTIDPTLIGGFTLDIEHDRMDASIAGRLKQLKEELGVRNEE